LRSLPEEFAGAGSGKLLNVESMGGWGRRWTKLPALAHHWHGKGIEARASGSFSNSCLAGIFM